MDEKKFVLLLFSLIFIVISLVIGWNDFSWFFNSNYISYAFEDEKPIVQVETINNVENSIEIEKIGIKAPLVIPDGSDPTLKKELDLGVVFFSSSSLPGEAGETIILGHSAPPNWPKIKYDWVFTDLEKLVEGDVIYVYYEGRKYTYKVKDHIIIEKGQDESIYLTNYGNILVLMSCWPPGKDSKRIAVRAQEIYENN